MEDKNAIPHRLSVNHAPPEIGPVYAMRDGVIKDVDLLRLARCEMCGADAVYVHWPAGWIQTGGSRWDDKYSLDGIAWWCPPCRKNIGE